MRRITCLLLVVVGALLLGCGGGCGAEKDRGRNRDKDRPQSADKALEDRAK
jgi:hypothetical protein